MSDTDLSVTFSPRSAALGCAGIACLGSIGPWAHANLIITSVSMNGTDGGDGYITLGLCLVAIVALARRMDGAATVLGACSALLGIYHFVDIMGRSPLQPSWGIWAVCLGSGGVLAFGLWARDRNSP